MTRPMKPPQGQPPIGPDNWTPEQRAAFQTHQADMANTRRHVLDILHRNPELFRNPEIPTAVVSSPEDDALLRDFMRFAVAPDSCRNSRRNSAHRNEESEQNWEPGEGVYTEMRSTPGQDTGVTVTPPDDSENNADAFQWLQPGSDRNSAYDIPPQARPTRAQRPATPLAPAALELVTRTIEQTDQRMERNDQRMERNELRVMDLIDTNRHLINRILEQPPLHTGRNINRLMEKQVDKLAMLTGEHGSEVSPINFFPSTGKNYVRRGRT